MESLYSKVAFPEGDRGGNGIRVANGRNLHAVWDSLLGQRPSPGDVRRRVIEIQNDSALALAGLLAADDPSDFIPETWLSESRMSAKRFVYTPEIIEQVNVVERGLTESLPSITLADDYLKSAGRVAQLRASQAGARLACIWETGLIYRSRKGDL